MTKGVIFKCNGSSWSKTIVKDTGIASANWDDGLVKHWDAVNNGWQLNYPMEQSQQQTFNVVWTQAYNKSGTKLDSATWGDHPRAGDSIDFIGLWGFDNNAMKAFVGDGKIEKIQFEVMFDDPSHAGNPSLIFGAHAYTSKPSKAGWDDINNLYTASSVFNQTGSDYTRKIDLPSGAWIFGGMGGLAVWAKSATAGNSARFAGKTTSHSLNSFNTTCLIQVLK